MGSVMPLGIQPYLLRKWDWGIISYDFRGWPYLLRRWPWIHNDPQGCGFPNEMVTLRGVSITDFKTPRLGTSSNTQLTNIVVFFLQRCSGCNVYNLRVSVFQTYQVFKAFCWKVVDLICQNYSNQTITHDISPLTNTRVYMFIYLMFRLLYITFQKQCKLVGVLFFPHIRNIHYSSKQYSIFQRG